MLKDLMNKFRKESDKFYPDEALMNAYARLPVCFVRGEGARLWDDDGREYLDVLGGIAVTFLGHCHPRISEAISLQATKLLHISNLFHIEEQTRLGKKFCEISGMDKVFFANTGAEANEAAIKISRLIAHTKGIDNPAIITMHSSFHGRTMATLSASGNPNIQKGYHPLVQDFIHVDFNDIEAVKEHATNPNVVALMLEPIQGEGGIIIPDDGYLREVRSLCDQQGWLLILDEIQTGMGRTGHWFAHQHEDILPDVLTSAKALGNGIPIGACAARGAAAEAISPGAHGTTFGGNPFACSVGLTVIDIIEQDGLLAQASNIGNFLKKQLQQTIGTHEKVMDIRGRGLMIGIQLDQAYPDLARLFLRFGLVVNVTAGGTVIRLLPSVVMTESQAKRVAEITCDVISSL